jgi:phage head maturation protease
VGVPVSIGARLIRTDAMELIHVRRHTLAHLDEVSILAPNEHPAYPGARISQMIEPSKESVALLKSRTALGVWSPGPFAEKSRLDA